MRKNMQQSIENIADITNKITSIMSILSNITKEIIGINRSTFSLQLGKFSINKLFNTLRLSIRKICRIISLFSLSTNKIQTLRSRHRLPKSFSSVKLLDRIIDINLRLQNLELFTKILNCSSINSNMTLCKSILNGKLLFRELSSITALLSGSLEITSLSLFKGNLRLHQFLIETELETGSSCSINTTNINTRSFSK